MSKPYLPSSTLESLALVPEDTASVLLLRHAHRQPIPKGTYGGELPATPEGLKLACELGSQLAGADPGRVGTSPVTRCVSTAEALLEGAGWSVPVERLWQLGGPGPFVVDTAKVGPLFLEHGTRAMVDQQLGESDVPGMRSTGEGVKLLVDEMFAGPVRREGPGVFVTHDSIIAVTLGWLWQRRWETDGDWPRFIEGLILWRDGVTLGTAWRGECRSIDWPA